MIQNIARIGLLLYLVFTLSVLGYRGISSTNIDKVMQ